jgi:hypothetical protein
VSSGDGFTLTDRVAVGNKGSFFSTLVHTAAPHG